MKRQLILEDGTCLVGEGFGSLTERHGEVVFTTGMTGYQETLSDPSYCGQIVTFTYPLIGNYGINRDDFESIEPAVAGIIVNETTNDSSHWKSQSSLDTLLKSKNIPGLQGIDTRKLTRIIRKYGTLKGKICSMDVEPKNVIKTLKEQPLLKNQIKQVSTKDPYALPGRGYRVVVIDLGVKKGILRELIERNCDIIVVPYNTSSEEIFRLNPDGVFLTNGPGNPKDVPEVVETIKQILGKVPLFGICMGHQLLSLACGANTVKLKYGHRGSNHPVKELATGKVSITSQNHGYTVEEHSLQNTKLIVTHVAVNDGTVEGVRHTEYPAFSIQYHPEASPGPQDANDLFDSFIKMMNTSKKAGRLLCQSV